ncbi:MAG: sugar phosphate isomerase/epimerase [Methanobacteriaceae archaeon]|nr:sugar phosphate isomerase/epimerase [Methanobacteriaceae archaeon]MDP3485871.1 sugar phosphate isomerase/epimerase [Methanobacteriaceae archaeon]MDP3622879.1 sugar phosphate isomerase/epimerase [Methanobacteriaceae archaeon]
MKIGVSTLALYPNPLEDILPFLEDLKVDYCEIINEYPLNEVKCEIFESYTIKTTVHSPISDMNLASPNESIRKASIEQVKKSINLANKLNANIVVVHPGQVPFLARIFQEKIIDNNFKSLSECADYADAMGIKMCVENMPDMEGYLFKDINHLNNLVGDLGVFMTLDVGHAHNTGFSTEEMVKSDRLRHIHLSDNDGSFDNHEALGKGTIDFDNLVENINKINYNGVLTIEVKNREEVLESLRFLKNKNLN